MPEAYSRKRRLTRSAAERKLGEALGLLRSMGLTFRRQAPKGSDVVNFTSDEGKLVIEIDANREPDERQARYNETRIQLLEARGFRFLRFWTQDVDRNMAQVMATIMGVLRDQHDRIRAAAAAARSAPPPAAEDPGKDDLPPPRRHKAAG